MVYIQHSKRTRLICKLTEVVFLLKLSFVLCFQVLKLASMTECVLQSFSCTEKDVTWYDKFSH